MSSLIKAVSQPVDSDGARRMSRLSRWHLAWRESLRFRLLALGLVPLLIAFPVIVAMLVIVGGERADSLLVANLRSNLAGASNYLSQVKAEAGSRVSQLVKSERLVQLVVDQPDKAELERLLNTTAMGSGLDFLVVATQDGVVLASSSGVEVGRHLPASYVVRQAGIGLANAAYERVGLADLAAFSPRFPTLVQGDDDTRGEAGETPAQGLLINAAAHFPLAVNKVDAILVGGILLNKNTALIEHMREVIFPVGVLPGDAEGMGAVYLNDVEIAISRQRQQRPRGLGSRIDHAISQAVLGRGESWIGPQMLGDVSYRVGFEAIADGDGQHIGMISVGIPDGPYRRETLILLGVIAGLMAVTMLGLSVLFLRAGRALTQRLDAISGTMLAVRAGRSDARVLASMAEDEVGRLGQHFNDLLDTIAHQDAQRQEALQTIADEASRRRAIFENERDGVAILNPDGSVFEVNPKVAAMLGYSQEELLALRVSDWDARLQPGTMFDILAHAGSDGYFYEGEHRRKDGTCYAAEVSISRADWADRTFVLLVQRDISERKAFEAELEKYRSKLERLVAQRTKELNDRSEQLNTIFALSPDGFVSFDREGQLAFANQSFLRMTGLCVEDLVGLDETSFSRCLGALSLPGAPFPGVSELRALCSGEAGAGATGNPRRRVFELQGPGNRVLEVGLRLSESPGVSQILYFRDVTHETEVDRMKSEFLSTAAHELRTPMASIYGFSQLLTMRPFGEEQRQEMMGTILKQSELMISIINELLDLARIEARRGKDFVLERLSLQAVVAETVAGFKLPAERQPPVLVDCGEALTINADRKKMQQALLNVLSNAYKYSPGGGDVTIAFSRQERAGVLRVGVEIRDHGIGMAPEQLARVFERFYRADASGNIPGTGLGMSVVKEIIELHGGEVALSSSAGQGTTVTVWLPAARSDSEMPG